MIEFNYSLIILILFLLTLSIINYFHSFKILKRTKNTLKRNEEIQKELNETLKIYLEYLEENHGSSK